MICWRVMMAELIKSLTPVIIAPVNGLHQCNSFSLFLLSLNFSPLVSLSLPFLPSFFLSFLLCFSFSSPPSASFSLLLLIFITLLYKLLLLPPLSFLPLFLLFIGFSHMNRRAKALLDCLLSLHDSPLNRLVIKRCSTEIHIPPSLVEKNLHSLRLFGFSTSRSSERAFQGCLTSSGVMTRLDFSLIRQSKERLCYSLTAASSHRGCLARQWQQSFIVVLVTTRTRDSLLLCTHFCVLCAFFLSEC